MHCLGFLEVLHLQYNRLFVGPVLKSGIWLIVHTLRQDSDLNAKHIAVTREQRRESL